MPQRCRQNDPGRNSGRVATTRRGHHTITIDGKNWRHDAQHIRRMMGISLQETKFIDKMTVQETLDLFGSFYRLGKDRSLEIMDRVNLRTKKDTFVVNLSGRQRQKLALGVALLNYPPLLLLNEPTTGLDQRPAQNLGHSDGPEAALSHHPDPTHYTEEAAALCDRVVIMDQGRILADGTLQTLLNNFASGEIIDFELEQPVRAEVLAVLTGLIYCQWIDPGLKGHFTVANITEALPVMLSLLQSEGIGIREFEYRKKTLDDLFVALTGRSLQA